MTMEEIDRLRARADEAIDVRRQLQARAVSEGASPQILMALQLQDMVIMTREEDVINALSIWWKQGFKDAT